ncbi:copper resistance CopC family protein [Metabacillus fastidiosus]|uniref:copper resistance CopC family protein n=1 Tax=Metabacillus fastidiosus TaxID=1458 RepID=UPI002DBF2E3B|nr:copper resistance protein CopC [Metabacillus fastidiosus]MEC2075234.1 copper resistance protein CopC [Metabacillus fastidiosus]
MSKKIFIILLILLSFPTIVSAHTTVSHSTPAEGEVIRNNLLEVTVNFTEEIEKISTIELLSKNNEIPFKRVTVEDNKLIGQLEKPLENGSYRINWNIIAQDGHPLTGEIPFTVEKEKEKEETNTVVVNENATPENIANDSTNIVITIIITILIAIILFGFIILGRKRG